MLRAVAAAAALIALAGCTHASPGAGTSPAPAPFTASPRPVPRVAPTWQPGFAAKQGPVDWSKQRPGLKQDIETAAMTHDCAWLEELFAEATEDPKDNPEVLTHIDRWGVHVGCFEASDGL